MKGVIGLIEKTPWLILASWVLLSPVITVIAPIAHYTGWIAIDLSERRSLFGVIAIFAIVGDAIFVSIVGLGIKSNYDKNSRKWYCRIITWVIVAIGRISLILKRC